MSVRIIGIEMMAFPAGCTPPRRSSVYRRSPKSGDTDDTPAFNVDAGKLAEETRFDGTFILRANAKVTLLQAVRYGALLSVENRAKTSGTCWIRPL